ncbi:MAG: hypothetical protein ACI837_002682 [Crocinitomicaceae bacterium]|jgi:hypothetical protein
MHKVFLPIIMLLASLFSSSVSAQYRKHFTGMLEYKISVRDTSMRGMVPDNKMIVYTNDTVVRIENFTGNLGKQVAIKHMMMGKSYLLLETDFGKFALQMDLDEEISSAEPNPNDTVSADAVEYTYKKKCFKRKILGKKVNRIEVSHKDFPEPIEFLYMKGYSSKIVDAYPDISGIPVRYSVPMTDAVLDYELVKISEYTPNRDLFGISDDYERISFDAFMDRLIQSKETMQGENGP